MRILNAVCSTPTYCSYTLACMYVEQRNGAQDMLGYWDIVWEYASCNVCDISSLHVTPITDVTNNQILELFC